MILDLDKTLRRRYPKEIAVRATYDPGFFPDGSSFVFQGQDHLGICPIGMLLDPNREFIDFNMDECTPGQLVTVYQSLGAGLEGEDYYVASGTSYASDYGNFVNQDPIPAWGAKGWLDLHPVVQTGSRWEVREKKLAFAPYAGDWVMSPSGWMIAARISGVDGNGDFKQQGLQVFGIEGRNIRAGEEPELKPLATICKATAKATFSYDERFLVWHHYTSSEDWQELGYSSPDDEEFKELVQMGNANVFAADLRTGEVIRITNVQAGQVALFPHFRADGWLYFLVKDAARGAETIVVSDAVINWGRSQGFRAW